MPSEQCLASKASYLHLRGYRGAFLSVPLQQQYNLHTAHPCRCTADWQSLPTTVGPCVLRGHANYGASGSSESGGLCVPCGCLCESLAAEPHYWLRNTVAVAVPRHLMGRGLVGIGHGLCPVTYYKRNKSSTHNSGTSQPMALASPAWALAQVKYMAGGRSSAPWYGGMPQPPMLPSIENASLVRGQLDLLHLGCRNKREECCHD
jgi:hypothetical protein